MTPSLRQRLALEFVQRKVTHVPALDDNHNEFSDVFGVISDPRERARGWCFEMDENEGTRTKTRCAG